MTGDAAARVVAAVPGLPRDADGPVFRAPWEAQAFAMAVALHQRGLFTWPEWAAALAAEIKRAQAAGDPDSGDTYYQHWLCALERRNWNGLNAPLDGRWEPWLSLKSRTVSPRVRKSLPRCLSRWNCGF